MKTSFYSTILLLLLLLLFSVTAITETTSFAFQDGFSSANITLIGSATIAPNGLLSLATNASTGTAFFSTPLPFRDPSTRKSFSFSSSFACAMIPKYPWLTNARYGLAFVISAYTNLSYDPAKENFKLLGMFNNFNRGNSSNHILAVEFATFPNLVGIDVNWIVNSSSAGYISESNHFTNLNLVSEKSLQAWVEYNNTDMRLDVTIAPLNVSSKPRRPLISRKVDLSQVMLEHMYVGFTGATSADIPVSSHVQGWSFRVNGTADPLDSSKLPELPKAPKAKRKVSLLIIALPLVTAAVVLLIVGGIYVVVKRRAKYAEVLEDWEHEYGPHRISYRELFKATQGFHESELLGIGGFGKVYKGVLSRSKTEVAVKRVSHESRQGMREFVAEIASIGRLRHRNLVQLLGYCRRKGELLLVYDYMPNGSLDRLLFDSPRKPLDWNRRVRIIKGVAAGLLYLHEEWEQVVIHRDVKASNVMLDGEYNARLGDFGLARLCDHGAHPQTTRVVGTMGYLAPEITREGRATKATDVFAFGVFVLEVVCGRRPIEPRAERGETVLVDWVVRRWMEGGNLAGAADGRMGIGYYKQEEVEIVMRLGLQCAHGEEEARPSMRDVVQVLQGDLNLPDLPKEYYRKGCVGGGKAWGLSSTGGEIDTCVLSGASSSAVGLDSSIFPFGGR